MRNICMPCARKTDARIRTSWSFQGTCPKCGELSSCLYRIHDRHTVEVTFEVAGEEYVAAFEISGESQRASSTYAGHGPDVELCCISSGHTIIPESDWASLGFTDDLLWRVLPEKAVEEAS